MLFTRAYLKVANKSAVLGSSRTFASSAILKTQVEQITEEEKVTTISNTADDITFLRQINRNSLKVMEELAKLDSNRRTELFSQIDSKISNQKNLRNLDDELKNFFEEFIGTKEKFQFKSGKEFFEEEGFTSYPFLRKSLKSQPFNEQELFLRRQHASKTSGKLGSNVHDVYKPYTDLSHPINYKDLTIEKLMASGAHLGHHYSLWRPSTQPYIFGTYKDIHIIDLEQTLSHLRRAAKVIEGIAEKGGIILFLGTREGQESAVESAAKRSNGYYVSHKWVPGTITNSTEISKNWGRHEVDYEDIPTNKKLSDFESTSIIKPDIIVVLNPTENRVALKEAIQARVPTIGLIDTDSEPSLVTYPIPANDDSIRATNLICGILGKAGEIGKNRRLQKVKEYKDNYLKNNEAAKKEEKL